MDPAPCYSYPQRLLPAATSTLDSEKHLGGKVSRGTAGREERVGFWGFGQSVRAAKGREEGFNLPPNTTPWADEAADGDSSPPTCDATLIALMMGLPWHLQRRQDRSLILRCRRYHFIILGDVGSSVGQVQAKGPRWRAREREGSRRRSVSRRTCSRCWFERGWRGSNSPPTTHHSSRSLRPTPVPRRPKASQAPVPNTHQDGLG